MIFDPNIAYVILVLAFVLEVLALAAPGTGFLEVFAAGMMLVAGYALFQLPFNAWALIVLLAGLLFFFMALRRETRWQQWLFLALSLLSLWAGSAFMLSAPHGGLAINPILAGIVSLLSGVFMWFVFVKGIEAVHLPVMHNVSAIIGMEGFAVTEIGREGSVQVGGETWSACSPVPVKKHSRVRVLARHGLILDIEEIKEA
jgi:membrane-bound serine protease (ClpP class)